MLERTISSLTAGGPTCLISILETLGGAICPRVDGGRDKAQSRKSPQKRDIDFIVAVSIKCSVSLACLLHLLWLRFQIASRTSETLAVIVAPRSIMQQL